MMSLQTSSTSFSIHHDMDWTGVIHELIGKARKGQGMHIINSKPPSQVALKWELDIGPTRPCAKKSTRPSLQNSQPVPSN